MTFRRTLRYASHPLQQLRKLRSLLAFARHEGGNVAVTFGLTVIPILGLVGAAVDYSRANNARSAMQAALDSTSLMISTDASTLTATQLTTKAQNYFAALYNHPETTTPTITATYTATSSIGSKVVVTGSMSMPTTFMKVMGYSSLPISTSSTAAWGNTRLRVALVLDTTGSMAENGKMTALQPAAKSLIDQLSAAATNAGDVYISIVPFSKDVNVGTSNKGASWLDWTAWNTANGSCSNNNYTTQSSCLNKNKTWTPDSTSTWNGCVTDRDQDYDISNTTPSGSSTLFPAEQYGSCPESLMALSYDWTSLKAKIDALYPNGNTNQAIGLAWGWQSLTSGLPLSAPAEDANYQYNHVLIIMSDGLNTQDRWYTDASSIDTREATLCTKIKAAKITIYAIQVNTNSDPTSTVLSNCASDSSKFFMLTRSSQIAATFSAIGTALSKLRIAY